MIFKILFEGFKYLNVHLILVQKLSNFFVSFYRAFKILGKFLKDYPLDNFPYLYFQFYLWLAKVQISM